MVEWLSALKYFELFKDLKKSVPELKKSQETPERPESKNNAVEFLWGLKVLYTNVKKIKQLNIPQYQFLENLEHMPNDKAEFEKKVRENMLEVRNQKLCIKKPVGESEPIGDFSSDVLNQIENWALAAFGTFKKS